MSATLQPGAVTSWPIPAPGDIASRCAAVFEQQLQGIDARNPNTVATTICRVTELAMQDLYNYQGKVAVETMPDTAVQNLPRFGTIYGVAQVPAASASGAVTVTGVADTVIEAGVVFTYPGTTMTWLSQGSAEIPTGETTVAVDVVAASAGIAGNLAAGSILTISVPQEGLTSQQATVTSAGLTGGAAIQSPAGWRGDILQEIRDEPSGGSYADYVKWAYAALPNVALAACPPGACGGGVVSVVIAMTGLVAPTSGQIAAVLAYINTLRPVSDVVTVYGAALNPVNVSLHVSPNTATIQAAAQAALALAFQQNAVIGGATYFSQLENAVASSDGETFDDMLVNGAQADVAAPSLFALNVLGTVTFT